MKCAQCKSLAISNDRGYKAIQRVLQYLNYTTGGQILGAGAATVEVCVNILREALEPETGLVHDAVKTEDLPF